MRAPAKTVRYRAVTELVRFSSVTLDFFSGRFFASILNLAKNRSYTFVQKPTRRGCFRHKFSHF